MKLSSALLVALVAGTGVCTAQPLQHSGLHGADHRLCAHAGTHAALLQTAASTSAVVRRPYDVLSYNLELDWRGPLSTTATTGAARQFRGINTMRIRIDSAAVSAIEVDARNQSINRVIIDESEVAAAQPVDGILTIPLPATPEPGTELTLRIEYTYIGDSNTGFHLYAKNAQVPERIAYTLGAPDYARYWMPCNDNPHDKASARFSVVVPTGYTVACNGLPEPPVENGDALTWVWHDTTQIATYLMVVHASVYRHFSDTYQRQDGEAIPLLYYVWEQDYDGEPFSAKEQFAPVPDMMAHFAAHYGEYPFSKYGMAVAMPFTYFAMEHQTMTTLVRAAINEELTIAHELAHQWLGDLVTPATWNDIWMNEGGATFSEALWGEFAGGQTRYREIMAEKRGAYLAGNADGTRQPPCYRELDANPIGNDLYNYATTYAKGAWVYHMLRTLAGDDVFFPMLRSFLDSHAFGAAETHEMIAAFEQYIAAHSATLPVPVGVFFDQWVFKKGHPVYEASAAVGADGDAFAATVLLKQTQPTQVFTMPVDIGFTGANGEQAVRTMLLGERERQETFALPFLPVSVTVDPDEKILCVVKPAVVTAVGDADTGEPESLQVYPNPATGGVVQIRYSLEAPAVVSMEIYNTVGERVALLHQGTAPAGLRLESWDTTGMPAGTYVVRLNAGTKSILHKVCIGR